MSSPNLVKELREKSGAGFMDCKKALDATGGDLDRAMDWLRERGAASAAKKAGRAANDGLVHSYIHSSGKIGVLVEINCETDFVARTDDFRGFVNDVCLHIAATNPKYVSREQLPSETAADGADDLDAQCLLTQPFVKDPGKTIQGLVQEMIAKVGENIVIRRFSRFQLGELNQAEGT